LSFLPRITELAPYLIRGDKLQQESRTIATGFPFTRE
jgi:hypothetical protein